MRTVLSLLCLLALACGAAFAADAKIPDFSQTARDQVPAEFKWRLQDIYPSDQAWTEEMAATRGRVDRLSDFKPGQWTRGPRTMADFLGFVSKIQERLARLYLYASMAGDMDLADARFLKMKGEVQAAIVKLQAQLAFIGPDVLQLGQAKLGAFAQQGPELKPFLFGLQKIQRGKDHVLPEEQERISALTGIFASSPGDAAGLLNDVDLPAPEVTLSDGTKVLLNTANYGKYRQSTTTADRRLVMAAHFANQKRFENTFACVLDAAMKMQWFQAQVHKFPSCLDASLFENNIDPAVYRNLLSAIHENLAPLHRLIKLRQRLLKLDKFTYGDIYAPPVSAVDRPIPYEEARAYILEAMKPLGKEYGDVLQKAFADGWIDVYPNRGKQSGAYSNGVYGVHSFVKMNYDGTFANMSTLAHELGHAMHSWFSNKTQPFPTAEYPTFLAEIASTFNEHMLMHWLLRGELPDDAKLVVLDGYLERIRSTVYRQALFAEFELAIHEQVEKGQTLTPDWLNAKYLELTRLYYGHEQGVVQVDDYIQSEWSAIPHFYMNYYVYQYSTGMVASMALADMVGKGGEAERARYIKFLSAGGSQYPLDTLRDAGVDMSSPAPVRAALQVFSGLVDEMEKLVAKREK